MTREGKLWTALAERTRVRARPRWTAAARSSDVASSRRRGGGGACFGDGDASAAALFCCELMRRTDLVASPVVHAKLVDFLSELLRTARASRPGPGRDASSVFYGSRRGLAGAIMDHERLRRELPSALMCLYCDLQAVVGLDVDADQSFDKFSVRHRINALLLQFWRHPLLEPRDAMLAALGDETRATASAFMHAALGPDEPTRLLRSLTRTFANPSKKFDFDRTARQNSPNGATGPPAIARFVAL